MVTHRPIARTHQSKRNDVKRHPQVAAPVVSPPAAVVPPAAAAPKPPVVASVAPAPAPAPPPPATLTLVHISAATTAKTMTSNIGSSPSHVSAAPRVSASSPGKSSPTSGSANGGASNKGGLSGAGIAAIIVVVVLALAAALFFIMRKRSIKKRKNKRNWERGLLPEHDGASEKSSVEPLTPQYQFQGQANSPVPPLTPLTPSYNNPTYPTYPTSAAMPPSTPGSPMTPMRSSAVNASGKPTAIIRCTFIPTLPDELSITTGEIVTVVSEYDDGWALCANVRGEQGMVPLECLEKGSPMPRAPESDWKNAQRASSLIARDGVRY